MTHPKTRYVVFTGSEEAGLRISDLAAKKQPGQIWIKRTVLEMGGKDAIVADDEADIGPAVEGVLVPAFGYQGRKCSACSRAIVVRKVYDKFLDKLEQRAKSIQIGPPEDLDTFVGPVINEACANPPDPPPSPYSHWRSHRCKCGGLHDSQFSGIAPLGCAACA